MAAEARLHEVGDLRHDRDAARYDAACAIQLVARSLAVDPAVLSAAAYRRFCATHDAPGLPSSLAISVLFVGWQRACEQVAALIHEEADVEADVLLTLYGDPSRRHRIYETRSHRATAKSSIFGGNDDPVVELEDCHTLELLLLPAGDKAAVKLSPVSRAR
jgi:hypothetical protein